MIVVILRTYLAKALSIELNTVDSRYLDLAYLE